MASPSYQPLYAKPDPSDCRTVCSAACQLHNLCPSPSSLPPPSASPFSTPADDDPVSTPIRFHRHSAILPAVPVAAASFVVGALLLLVAVLLFVRYRPRRDRASAPVVVAADGDLFFEDADHEFDHHVWYIRTVGLDESTIGAITAWAYKSDEDGILGSSVADCAVCLGEFKDGELLRLLPKCGHAFHQPCIDTWLRSHVNCPLCRAHVVVHTSNSSTTNTSSEGPRNIDPSPSGSSFRLPSSAVLEPSNSRLAEGTSSPLESIPRGSGQEIDCERLGFELQEGISINRARGGAELGVSSDGGFWGDGLKAIRRSPSMDSLPLSSFVFRLKSVERSAEEGIGPHIEGGGHVCKKRGEEEHASKRGSLLKETERSFSSVSRRFYLSRHGHIRGSILPL